MVLIQSLKMRCLALDPEDVPIFFIKIFSLYEKIGNGIKNKRRVRPAVRKAIFKPPKMRV